MKCSISTNYPSTGTAALYNGSRIITSLSHTCWTYFNQQVKTGTIPCLKTISSGTVQNCSCEQDTLLFIQLASLINVLQNLSGPDTTCILGMSCVTEFTYECRITIQELMVMREFINGRESIMPTTTFKSAFIMAVEKLHLGTALITRETVTLEGAVTGWDCEEPHCTFCARDCAIEGQCQFSCWEPCRMNSRSQTLTPCPYHFPISVTSWTSLGWVEKLTTAMTASNTDCTGSLSSSHPESGS